jgi:hypothetical protein
VEAADSSLALVVMLDPIASSVSAYADRLGLVLCVRDEVDEDGSANGPGLFGR